MGRAEMKNELNIQTDLEEPEIGLEENNLPFIRFLGTEDMSQD